MNNAQPGDQANVEFFFRLLYNCLHGGCFQGVDMSWLEPLAKEIWVWIIYLGYLLAIIGLYMTVHATIHLFELRKREAEYYGTLILAPDAVSGGHPRWENIQELINGSSSSQWREAIIEADIMLDDALGAAGYAGETVADKLKSIGRSLASYQQAWEAHRVRNQIAHEGSAFEITEQLARRTIGQYESVFRELKEIP